MKDFIRNKIREGLSGHDIDMMLNQIKNKNCDCCKYFDMEDIKKFGGMENPLYFMIQKNEINELEFMDPKQYIHKIARGFGISFEDALGGAFSDERAKKYAQEMKDGAKFPIGHYTDGQPDQEGRHRAYAAIILGCKAVPMVKKLKISPKYVHNFVTEYKDLDRQDMNRLFKEKGYHGISDLDWREFTSYVNYRL